MLQVVKSWLESIVKELEANVNEDRFHQLTVVFFVLYSVSKLYPQYQQLRKCFIVSVLKIVSLNANLQACTCQEYNFIQECLLSEKRLVY